MSKLASRLGVFLVGIPVVLLLVLLNICNHLPFHFLAISMVLLGSMELYDMMSRKTKLLSKPFVVSCAVFLPVVSAVYSTLTVFTDIKAVVGPEIVTYAYIITVLVILFAEVFTAQSFDDSILKIASSIFIITYCGFLFTFVSKLTLITDYKTKDASILISIFALMVFFCDSFAWFFGVLFGKKSRGIVKASPNKSLVGFFGGFIGSIAAGLIGYFCWPIIFNGSIVKTIILGIFMAAASIIGDLAESVFKRSTGVKDSGTLMPGRGGILDSIDSILMAAPVYYFLISILYGYGQ